MKGIVTVILAVLLHLGAGAQIIQWENVTSSYEELPEGVRFFEGTREGSATFKAWYYEVDMNNQNIGIKPYLSSTSMQLPAFVGSVGAYAAINGGYFSGSTSFSSVVHPGQVLSRNITALTRFDKTYPVVRSMFSVNEDRSMSVDWVYHHSLNFDDIYVYDDPLNYICEDPNPKPAPTKAEGNIYENIAYGMGGAPVLIKDGQNRITYCEEIMWGSGVYLTDYRPRTAVGYTPDNKAILFVTNSMKIGEMADVLLSLGCHEAMNLDGGGSSATATANHSVYNQNRAVPTILAIVHKDELDLPMETTFEKFFDTSDEGVTSEGSWLTTANDGFWVSQSQLHSLGTNNQFYEFPLNLPFSAELELYAWWTAHSNRATDTPFHVTHSQGTDIVHMNQSEGGSLWNLVGSFTFNGDESQAVRITAAATTNDYVVADGLRLVSYDQNLLISEMLPIEDISVPVNTSAEEAIAQLSPYVVLMDGYDNQYEAELDWVLDDYNPSQTGDYLASSHFELPEGMKLLDSDQSTITTATVTVTDDATLAGDWRRSISVFPNPSDGIFTLRANVSGVHTIEVFALDGTLIFKDELQGDIYSEINLADAAAGLYFMKIHGKYINETIKLVVQ